MNNSVPPAEMPPEDAPPATRRRALRGWKLWLVRLTLVLTAPLLFFAGLELGLRLFGFGYPTTFFVRAATHGDWVTNPKYGWQYFPMAVATMPAPQVIPAQKPPGSFRIVILGDSAAYGTPRSAYSFGRMLEVLLRQQYPGVQFDVINACLPSITSHGVLRVARDSLVLEPDMFIVFTGNNEVIGPYGVGTVFREHSPNLWMVRAAIRLRATRTGQMLLRLAPGGGWGRSDQELQGVKNRMVLFLDHQVTMRDARLDTMYRHYRANLTDLCRLAQAQKIPLLLCTIPVNLRDWPPLASKHRPDLTPDDLRRWQTHLDQGLTAKQSGQWAQAIVSFTQALALDDQHARLHYLLAQCLSAAGRDTEAAEHFQQACDLDTLRFRSTARTNEVIRQIAGDPDLNSVRLLDAVRIFADRAPHGVPGHEAFYEHVHFTPDGNYLMARSAMEALHAMLPTPLQQHRTDNPPAELPFVADRLALTAWDRAEMDLTIAITIANLDPDRGPEDPPTPLILQAQEAMQAQATKPDCLEQTLRLYQQAIDANPRDPQLRSQFVQFLKATPQHDLAEEQLLALTELTPNFWQFHVQLAQMLSEQGRTDQALTHLRQAVSINSEDPLIRMNVEMLMQVAPADSVQTR